MVFGLLLNQNHIALSVLVVFIRRMHLEFMVTLVEIVTFVDNMVIERPIAPSVHLSFEFLSLIHVFLL